MKKFKKKIQFYFKKIFQIFFVLIYGKIKHANNSVIFDKILKKLLQQGFGQYESINFLKNKFSLDGNF